MQQSVLSKWNWAKSNLDSEGDVPCAVKVEAALIHSSIYPLNK